MTAREQYAQQLRTLKRTASALTEAEAILREWGWHRVSALSDELEKEIRKVVREEET